MRTIILNDDKLLKKDIENRVIKVRALIINDNNEILLSIWDNMYLLPGGKVRSEESFYEALKREVKEETGIILEKDDLDPFLLIEQYNKDYPQRDNKSFCNRLLETYYYIIYTNQSIDIDKIRLTDYEKEYGFKTVSYNLDKVEYIIESQLSSNFRSKYFKRELLTVLSEYRNLYKKEGIK